MLNAFYDPAGPELLVAGHACAGEPGRDLVCAAASMLACTLARSVPGQVEPGLAVFRGGDRAAYRAIWRGYLLLGEQFPSYVRCSQTMNDKEETHGT